MGKHKLKGGSPRTPKKKWGRIGAPNSAKRLKWLIKIRKHK